ncbi:TetR/AcrR family transcriptional regulator [Mycolicibacterium sphagni]|jgi:AcrR family transcriptional regulator|uniref:HTH tetR-type domain-containing protein n=1 Tax=Mycolicibacterium sphagni TaxID=1786 RepID=A0A255DLH5_9MYCO|nr:TetR/AcrR family transcriptional regulator [Mycolicibacterium sphagni]MCV7179151.1 TetR/AcrR family transcriptional regulator [Mycolicibacterium sphagni]OYN80299.1 hypothetical protein CG716_09110 [Mycolicibacterium sphagni]
MGEADRDVIVDTALELFINQGYNATTLDDIAAVHHLQPGLLAAEFPHNESFIFAVADAIFAGVFEELAKAQGEDLVEDLRAAHQRTVNRVIAGYGPVPLLRMHRMGRVIATNSAVAQAVSAHRKQALTRGLANQRGVADDDPQIVKAVTVWSAIMACTHAAAVHDQDEPDDFATDLTTRRLERTFNLVRRTQ